MRHKIQRQSKRKMNLHLSGNALKGGPALYSGEGHRCNPSEEDFRKLKKKYVHLMREYIKQSHEGEKTRNPIIARDRLTHLGTLTAGIVHELKGPLDFIKSFAELSLELLNDLRELEREGGIPVETRGEMDELIADLGRNIKKINEHTGCADAAVNNIFLHSHDASSDKRPIHLNRLLNEHLNIARDAVLMKAGAFNVRVNTSYDETIGECDAVPQELGRAFLIIFANAFDSVLREEEKTAGFSPEIRVSTKKTDTGIEIRIRENGPGILLEIKNDIFDSCLSTKPAGTMTEPGLSICREIITDLHGGAMRVEASEGEFAEFVIKLPAD